MHIYKKILSLSIIIYISCIYSSHVIAVANSEPISDFSEFRDGIIHPKPTPNSPPGSELSGVGIIDSPIKKDNELPFNWLSIGLIFGGISSLFYLFLKSFVEQTGKNLSDEVYKKSKNNEKS